MARDVFISYSSKDKPIADGICATLEAAKIRCWIAPRDILSGQDFPTAIANAISQCRVMVLIYTANSNSSDDVARELYLAAISKIHLISLRVENTEPDPGISYYLAKAHWLEVIDKPKHEQNRMLVEQVRSFVPEIAPTIKSAPRNKLTAWFYVVRDAPLTQNASHWAGSFLKKLFQVLAVAVIIALIIGASLAILLSVVMAQYAEMTLRDYSWDFTMMNPASPYELSTQTFDEQVAPYIEQHTFRTISDLTISFKSPNFIQLSGKVMSNSVNLDGIIYESAGLPQVRLEHLNGFPLPVIDGIISNGINKGLEDSWLDAPVRVKSATVVTDTLYIETIKR